MLPENVKKLRIIFKRLTDIADELSEFDLWDEDTMSHIEKAEKFVKNATTEIIEAIGVEDDENVIQ